MSSFKSILSAMSAKTEEAGRVVGIDIGSSSIKVVEVQNRNDVLTLTTYGELQLGPYTGQEVGQSVLLDAKQEQQALIDILRESAVKAKSAVFSMPLSSSFVTTIKFDAKPEEDLGSRVRIEARKYIPVPINEVALDWAEIGDVGDKKRITRDVLVAAIQTEALNRFKVLMQFVDLKEPPTEIECFSAIRAAFEAEEKHIAVIDIGALTTKLYLSNSGLLQRMHRVRAGGVLATKRIASTLQTTFEEIEVKKRSIQKDDVQFRDMQRAHHSVYEKPLIEFRQVIKEYEEVNNVKMDAIYVAGSGILFPTTQQLIADTLGTEIKLLNPFTKVAYPAFMEDMINDLGSTFHVALGAALRVFE